MQVNEEAKGCALTIEIGAIVVNILLLLTFYVANANHSTSGFATTGFGALAKVAFLAGLVALCCVIIARSKIKGSLARWALIVVVTFWNQACLTAFLASLIPFRLS